MFGFEGYYVLIRREEVKQTGTVSVNLDIEVMKKFVSNTSEEDGSAFEEDFDELFAATEDFKSDRNDKLKALMVVTAIALMNVDDLLGHEKAELVPFVTELVKDYDFIGSKQKQTSSSTQSGSASQAMAVVLFGSFLDDNVSTVWNFGLILLICLLILLLFVVVYSLITLWQLQQKIKCGSQTLF